MTRPVPFLALAQQTREIKRELLAAVEAVLDSGQFILGEEVSRFEREFAKYCQTKYALGIASGTCALHLALEAAGIGRGDEVITAPNSFVASASTIALVGATPVFADIGPDLNLDPNLVEEALTPKTRAILPVHLTGRPAPMTEIMDISRRRNLKVIEDAAQAVGAALNGKRVGGFGDAGCFSVHPLKLLHACGDGGVLTTNDPEIYAHIQKSRNHGLADRSTCEFWSYNCRLDEIQAAMLRVQFKHLADRTETQRRIARRYAERLRSCVMVPVEADGEYCVYQTYIIQADRRDDLQRYLAGQEIQTFVHYPIPIPLQPAARTLGFSPNDFPMTMKAAERILSLPIYPELTDDQQDYVIESILQFYGEK